MMYKWSIKTWFIFAESLYATWNSIEQHYFATLPLVYQNLKYERALRTTTLLEVPDLIVALKHIVFCDGFIVEMLLFRLQKKNYSSVVTI